MMSAGNAQCTNVSLRDADAAITADLRAAAVRRLAVRDADAAITAALRAAAVRRLAAIVFALGAASSWPAHAQTVAITNARVLTAAGAPLERATVVIRDGRIQA